MSDDKNHPNMSLANGRYSLTSFAGAGGMGTVYKAHDNQLNRYVAAKCVPNSPNQKDSRETIREAQILATINHKNILQVFDVVTDGNVIWIISEWLEGVSLDRIKLPLGNVCTIAIVNQIFLALAAIHVKCIFHRDLKPSNLFLTNAGNIKLIDFGVAFDPQKSSGETMVGTLQYCDPRIMAGESPNQSSDLYSTSLVLIELLSGKEVWPNLAPLPLYRLITKSLSSKIQSLTDGILPPLATIAMQGIAEVCKSRNQKEPFTAKKAAVTLSDLLNSLDLEVSKKILAHSISEQDFSDSRYLAKLTVFVESKIRSKSLKAKEKANWRAFANQSLGNSITLAPKNRRFQNSLSPLKLAVVFFAIAAAGIALSINSSYQSISNLFTFSQDKVFSQSPTVLDPENKTINEVGLDLSTSGFNHRAPGSNQTKVSNNGLNSNPIALANENQRSHKTQESAADPIKLNNNSDRPTPADLEAQAESSQTLATASPKGKQTRKNISKSPVASTTKTTSKVKTKPQTRVGVKKSKYATSQVSIVANTWADIFIDGKSLGRIPRVKPFLLKPGNHRIRISSPFVETLNKTVKIPDQKSFRIKYQLKKKTKEITFDLSPAGELTVDGKRYRSNKMIKLRLSYGNHRVIVKRPGLQVRRRSIGIYPNSPDTVRIY